MRPDFLKTGTIIRGIVLGILFLPNLLCADTDIGKTVVEQFNPAFTMGSFRSDKNPTPLPWSELGAQISMQSQGRGTCIRASKSGAYLESMFQLLAGEVGDRGLQLWSTIKGDPQTRFSVLATGLGRRKGSVVALEGSGRVEVEKDLIRFVRSGLVEEYTVSVDGVRQDFVIAEPPSGNGDLRVELSVAGATAQTSDRGATLILKDSLRQLSYHRLRVLDARNRQLPAQIVVESPRTLAVVVVDTNAVYPIRIDPTFSDEDWNSMDFDSGAEEQIHAVAVMDGNVYVGGSFTATSAVPANYLAKWNGTSWSGVGSGVDNTVIGLLVDGLDLYVCGWFIDVSASPVISANHIAKWEWDGSSYSWTALGSGMELEPIENTVVNTMAMDGDGNLYAGGNFTTAGGVSANSVAKWDGGTWTELGSGMGGDYPIVDSIVMDGSGNLYAGGYFTTAGGVSANRVAKWDGNAWSALGSGINSIVKSLAVDVSGNLYAGGYFTTAGGVSANRVAKWDGNAWSAMGTGVNSASGQGVYALASDDVGNLYVGGEFTAAGGVSASNIARWDGSSWSALGSGTDGSVSAITPSGDRLYVGGMFTLAGVTNATNVAYADNLPISPGIYYVDNVNGDDANNGRSEANAWETFHHGVDQINGGSAGSYTLNVSPGSSYSIDNGEALAELTISQSEVTVEGNGGTATIDGTDAAANWPYGIKITGSDVTLRNLHITGFTNTNGTGVEIVGGSNNTVENCRVYGNYDAISVSQSDNCTIQGCEVDNNLFDGISISESTNSLITLNTVHDNFEINESDGIIVQACNPEISRNTIYDNRFNISLQADSGEITSPTIKNNLIYQDTSGEVHYGILMGGFGTADPIIYHNTIDGGLYDGIYMDGTGNAPEIKYNIITGFIAYTSSAGIENYNSVGNPIIDYNDFYNNANNYSGCSAGLNDISVNPLYGGGGDYTLQVTSPCINPIPTGAPPNDPVAIDLNGDARPYGSGFDMGCYENQDLPAVSTNDASSVTTTSATSGGNVTSSGGESSVTTKGVCWSTSINPTVDLSTKTDNGSGTGSFTSAITGLTPNTTYHVRAYATNALNVTGYGSDKTFTTAVAVPGGTYYVNISSGSDSNDGSTAHPWKTLHHAISQINGGSAGTYVLHVALGTYSFSNGESNEAMVLSQSNITIIGERGSAPIVDGTGAQNWTKGLEVTGSNVIIENLGITGFSDTDEEGIRISGGTGNEIRYCKIYGNNWGIRVNEAVQTAIRNCEIYENSTHGIDDVLSTDTSVVENKFHDNLLYAIRTQSSSLISRNLIYDNTFGILVELINGSSASPTIKNNVVYEVVSGKMSYGIYIRAQNVSDLNPLIYHNTIDGGVLDGISMEEDGTGSSVPTIKYNIVSNFGQYGIQNSGANPTIDYNDVWNNSAANYSGIEVISGTNISEDPLYGSYSLQAASPCINTIPSSEGDPVTLDYPGFIRPRPGKATKDMGAYEYVADETVDYTLSGGTGLATDYRIFTIPLNLGTGADMLGAMENVLGSYDPVHWRAFLYNGTTYNEFNSSQFASHTITPGMGFWIITTYNDVIPFKGQPAPDGVDYVMELDPGWHMIGLPWLDTNIFLSSIKVTDGVNTYAISSQNNDLTQKFLWDYTGVDGYVKRSAAGFRLQNNKGYFLNVLSSSPIRMIIPNAANAAQSAPVDMDPNGVNTNDDEEPPPPPGAEPIPDIKVNGQDGPVVLNAGDSAAVSVSLDPGVWSGRNSDWWIAAHTPFDPPLDWYTYVYPEGWKPGIHVGVQMPLFEFSGPFSVLKMILPEGNYTFYFAVDGNMDGKPDATWMDSVPVKVE